MSNTYMVSRILHGAEANDATFPPGCKVYIMCKNNTEDRQIISSHGVVKNVILRKVDRMTYTTDYEVSVEGADNTVIAKIVPEENLRFQNGNEVYLQCEGLQRKAYILGFFDNPESSSSAKDSIEADVFYVVQTVEDSNIHDRVKVESIFYLGGTCTTLEQTNRNLHQQQQEEPLIGKVLDCKDERDLYFTLVSPESITSEENETSNQNELLLDNRRHQQNFLPHLSLHNGTDEDDTSSKTPRDSQSTEDKSNDNSNNIASSRDHVRNVYFDNLNVNRGSRHGNSFSSHKVEAKTCAKSKKQVSFKEADPSNRDMKRNITFDTGNKDKAKRIESSGETSSRHRIYDYTYNLKLKISREEMEDCFTSSQKYISLRKYNCSITSMNYSKDDGICSLILEASQSKFVLGAVNYIYNKLSERLVDGERKFGECKANKYEIKKSRKLGQELKDYSHGEKKADGKRTYSSLGSSPNEEDSKKNHRNDSFQRDVIERNRSSSPDGTLYVGQYNPDLRKGMNVVNNDLSSQNPIVKQAQKLYSYSLDLRCLTQYELQEFLIGRDLTSYKSILKSTGCKTFTIDARTLVVKVYGKSVAIVKRATILIIQTLKCKVKHHSGRLKQIAFVKEADIIEVDDNIAVRCELMKETQKQFSESMKQVKKSTTSGQNIPEEPRLKSNQIDCSNNDKKLAVRKRTHSSIGDSPHDANVKRNHRDENDVTESESRSSPGRTAHGGPSNSDLKRGIGITAINIL